MNDNGNHAYSLVIKIKCFIDPFIADTLSGADLKFSVIICAGDGGGRMNACEFHRINCIFTVRSFVNSL